MSTPSSPAVPAHPAFEKQDKATMNPEKAASAPAMLQYAKLESNPMAREHGGAASVYDVHQPDHVEKRAVRRRLRWLAFLFPAVCILATLSIQQHGCDGLSFSGNFFTGLGGQSSAIPTWTEALPPATTLAVDPRFSKRQEDNSTSTSSNSSSTSGSPPAETNLPNPLDETPSATVPVTAQPLPTVPNNPILPTPFPQAFDSSITQAFKSDSCFNFFSNMTSSAAFRTCRPFSLLLQTSNTFLSAQSNLTLLNNLIWGTCDTQPGDEQCSKNMAWFANNIQTACKVDLDAAAPLAVDTLTALQAFDVMYDAACIVDPTTSSYCFVSSARNPSPVDLYFYQLPLGITLPKNTVPSCSACARSVLNVYASALKSPERGASLGGLQRTYEGAAGAAVKACGSGYAQASLANDARAAAMGILGTWLSAGLVLMLMGLGSLV